MSAAAGLAVLDVLVARAPEGERAPGRSTSEGASRGACTCSFRGDRRRAGLGALRRGRPRPGSRLRRARAATSAHRAMNAMRERGVLVGVDGPGGNVLKIRPPMPFGIPEADLLTDVLTRGARTRGALAGRSQRSAVSATRRRDADLIQIPLHEGARLRLHGPVGTGRVVARVHALLVLIDDALVGDAGDVPQSQVRRSRS